MLPKEGLAFSTPRFRMSTFGYIAAPSFHDIHNSYQPLPRVTISSLPEWINSIASYAQCGLKFDDRALWMQDLPYTKEL